MAGEAQARRPVVLGVAGGSGSGKTTVANEILERVGRERIAVLPHDSYYRDLSHLPLDERRTVNFDHPDSFDNALFVAHIDELLAGRPVPVPTYDFVSYVRGQKTVAVAPRPVVLIEGILIFADALVRQRMDIKIFVDTEDDLRFIRRLLRDVATRGRSVDSVVEQYLSTVRPMHLEFVEPSKRYADVIVPRGGRNAIAIDMIAARIEHMLQS